MSHGGNEEIPEPNLMSLLDLVLQMVMFFIIVSNFVTEQNNQDIKLPVSTSALPIDRERKSLVILNVNDQGQLIESGAGGDGEEQALGTVSAINAYMRDLYSFYKDNRGEAGVKEMTIVVRGHQNANFQQLYRVMKAARDAGFPTVQLRATQASKNLNKE